MNAKRNNPRAMGLVELLLVLIVITGILAMFTLVTNSVRAQSADLQTRTTLRVLQDALTHYHTTYEAWPPPPASAALNALINQPADDSPIFNLSVVAKSDGNYVIRDGYGKNVRYNGLSGSQQPQFVSAGPDGRFGDEAATPGHDHSAVADNIYSSETQRRDR